MTPLPSGLRACPRECGSERGARSLAGHLDGLAAEAGRAWDVALAGLRTLPRVGTSTALLGWAAQREDAASLVLVDANVERPGGLPSEGRGWLEPGGAGVPGGGSRRRGGFNLDFAEYRASP